MPIYKGLDRQEIESQYYLRGLRPDYERTVIPGWVERSERFGRSARVFRDLQYGNEERNRIDFYPGSVKDSGLILYIHGGYWQRGDKSVYGFLAEPFLERGYSVALMNYTMCPEVRLSMIAPQARLAVSWLWRNAAELGFDRENFNVIGHSAGAHLAVEMMFTDWPAEAAALPGDLVRAGVAISGIYDLEPLLYCSENSRLGLDAEEAYAVSPIHRRPATDAPLLIAYGEKEPADMRRQSVDFVAKFRSHSRFMECFPIPNADHFDVIDVLGDEKSELFVRTMKTMSIE